MTEGRKVVAVVGMAGAGKSEVARVLEEEGFIRVRFGDITDEEIRRRGLQLNEENERRVREELRREHGMSAYARLNLPRIEAARQKSDVVLDGLYSWEEYTFFRDYYGGDFSTVAVWASPRTRYARLGGRAYRPLTREEAESRDRVELERLNKGGPIAMADFTVVNESSREDLKRKVGEIIPALREKN
ncbi:MAG: AAA family ATPase [Chloroflexota bacterium]